MSVTNEYYDWLCELVDIEGHNNTSYWMLARMLFTYSFEWFVDHDDNRISDALELREQFIDDEMDSIYDLSDLEMEVECSMLELFIAVAYRADSIVDHTDMVGWFWEILENLNLSRYSDDMFYTATRTDPVWNIRNKLDVLCNRKYSRKGKGGMLPLTHTIKDQREVEIWYQMQEYIMENYPV